MMDATALTPGGSDEDQLTISVTSSSAQSSAIGTAGTGDQVVRVFAEKACYLRVGADPTAEEFDCPLADGDRDYFVVPGGHKIAAIRDSEDGTLSITIMR